MKPIPNRFRRLIAVLSGTIGVLSCGAAAMGATAEAILSDLNRFLPEAKAMAIPAASVLPGRYVTESLGMGSFEVYLFPDKTFIELLHSDVGTSYEDGTWTVTDGLVCLKGSGAVVPAWAGKTRRFLPASVLNDGKARQTLLSADRWEETINIYTSGGENRVTLKSPFVFWLENQGGFKLGEVTALKKKFDRNYGRHSFDVMATKFSLGFTGDGYQQSDGSFVINAPTKAEITIGGVKVFARHIEISQEMDIVRLSDSVESAGGKLPITPGLRIFVDGKEQKKN